MESSIIESFFLIFTGAAVLASLALFTRQPLLIAYVILGGLLGPHGTGLVSDPRLLAEIAEIGIIFLLFLVGLDLQPSKLKNMIGSTLFTAIVSSVIFFAVTFGLLRLFGFSATEALVAGIACIFSSTIVGIKLLPTTVLHHRHIGELVVSLLLIQDVIAILALIALSSYSDPNASAVNNVLQVFLALPVLGLIAYLAVRFVLLPLIRRFDAFHEYIFLAAIGWCLGMAALAVEIGLSLEIGAFVAGVALATSPIAIYIAASLRPLRDFFLILFFFSVGAALDAEVMVDVAVPTILLSLLIVALKPTVFRWLLGWQGETPEAAWESGFRLGQASEFSLLVVYLTVDTGLLGEPAAHVVQTATVLTFLLSTYLVIFRYPSPIAASARLRRD